jgi:hypothetical protein
MPAPTTGGRTLRAVDVTLHASGAETATGNGTGVELGDKGTVRLLLVITAVAGTNPTLDITIETSSDNGVADAWRSMGTFAQQTATTTGVWKTFSGADRYVRSRRTIGGTGSPSFTYSITGEAV